MIPYEPQSATTPGETLLDLLDKYKMTELDLSVHMECSLKTVEQLISGRKEITPEIAMKLEEVFKVPSDYWLKHDAAFLKGTKTTSFGVGKRESHDNSEF